MLQSLCKYVYLKLCFSATEVNSIWSSLCNSTCLVLYGSPNFSEIGLVSLWNTTTILSFLKARGVSLEKSWHRQPDPCVGSLRGSNSPCSHSFPSFIPYISLYLLHLLYLISYFSFIFLYLPHLQYLYLLISYISYIFLYLRKRNLSGKNQMPVQKVYEEMSQALFHHLARKKESPKWKILSCLFHPLSYIINFPLLWIKNK